MLMLNPVNLDRKVLLLIKINVPYPTAALNCADLTAVTVKDRANPTLPHIQQRFTFFL